MTGRMRHVVGLLLGATLLGACGSTAVPSQPVAIDESAPSATTTPSAPAAPSATDEAPSPSSEPRSTPPAPTPTGRPATWSKPTRVTGRDCSNLSFTIDGLSGYHIAADCPRGIRIFNSTDGAAWTTTAFAPPAHRVELGPQLAVDGDTLYLATTLLAPTDGGCGDDGLREVGVYVRSRHLPDGAWSDPVRIGLKSDWVQAFRVAGSVIHAIVGNTSGDTRDLYYESQTGPTVTRMTIPGAVSASLRVGDDGRARIAYTTGDRLIYARVDGDRLVKQTVATTSEAGGQPVEILRPVLVLGAGDDASLLWTQSVDQSGGCADVDIDAKVGTWFGSESDSVWVSGRISPLDGEKALTLDPSTGQVHVILGGAKLQHLVRRADGSWAKTTLPATKGMGEPNIRVDPVTRRIVVVMVDYGGGGGIYVMTRG